MGVGRAAVMIPGEQRQPGRERVQGIGINLRGLIMMFGMPNQAMWHDFFGNTHTDAFSTRETLRQHEETTCDNKADGSAYWAPCFLVGWFDYRSVG